MSAAPPQPIHASAVAVDGHAVLILGASGAGKSTLALEMISRGADLVADDQVLLTRAGETVVATPPTRLAGLVEARGIGVLKAAHVASAPIALVCDLDQPEPERLPPDRVNLLLGLPVPLVYGQEMVALAAKLMILLRTGGEA